MPAGASPSPTPNGILGVKNEVKGMKYESKLGGSGSDGKMMISSKPLKINLVNKKKETIQKLNLNYPNRIPQTTS